ncbi:MAG: hypothetical protein HRT67_01350 [Flavobacteriaceae bacterium]|nr:hypothetical protein [Flavobacteriaceae bacterium]
MSFVLPFIKIPAFSKVVPQENIFRLPTLVLGKLIPEEPLLMAALPNVEGSSSFQWQWEYVLGLGMLVSLVLLLKKSLISTKLLEVTSCSNIPIFS